ncbi:MAG: N-acyl amino acid synthase FeeM domain-containing protein [Leptospirales bacterium]
MLAHQIDQRIAEDEEDIIVSFISTLPNTLTPAGLNRPEQYPEMESVVESQRFCVRLANTPERRESANVLIDRMYAWRGYTRGNLTREAPHRITLVSYGMDNQVIGTITVGMESKDGLLADENYHQELNGLRAQGRKVCEFNALAIDTGIKSKRVISSLFHIAMLYPWGLFGYTDSVIEVTPKHAKFYQRMLGFNQIGEERVCPRVNVAGVLLHLDFSLADAMITKVGGLMAGGKDEKSLYPYFFTKTDGDGILGRLKRMI